MSGLTVEHTGRKEVSRENNGLEQGVRTLREEETSKRLGCTDLCLINKDDRGATRSTCMRLALSERKGHALWLASEGYSWSMDLLRCMNEVKTSSRNTISRVIALLGDK